MHPASKATWLMSGMSLISTHVALSTVIEEFSHLRVVVDTIYLRVFLQVVGPMSVHDLNGLDTANLRRSLFFTFVSLQKEALPQGGLLLLVALEMPLPQSNTPWTETA
jgi:hypothetical protein